MEKYQRSVSSLLIQYFITARHRKIEKARLGKATDKAQAYIEETEANVPKTNN